MLLISTIVGIVQLCALVEQDSFDLKGNYTIAGFVLTVLPLSVFVFLVIVLVKVICLNLGNFKRRKEQFG
jgi:hypothetical protein